MQNAWEDEQEKLSKDTCRMMQVAMRHCYLI